ncbi:hypothetical protein EMCRGX_G003760 [Ephydatia muelleri]
MAMRSVEAERVAEELVTLFERVGIPKKILTDQGTNFTSMLLQELHRLLHIRHIHTSPYPPQKDGLVERFNLTLKMMLRKTAVKEGKDWDQLLPLEVEQSVAVSIRTFGSKAEKTQICDVVKLGLKARTGVDLELSLYVMPLICEPLSGQPLDLIVQRYPYLSGLDLADSGNASDHLEINILIGADYYWKVTTGRIVHGRVGPTAIETRLELACKEALSSKLFKDIDELYFSDFTTYMRSPQRSAASWKMLYLSLKRFMNFPKTGNMPVRARVAEDTTKSEDRAHIKGYITKWQHSRMIIGAALYIDVLKPASLLQCFHLVLPPTQPGLLDEGEELLPKMFPRTDQIAWHSYVH